MKYLKGSPVILAVALSTVLVFAAAMCNTVAAAGPNDTISPSIEQQGVAISPIPFDKLNLKNRPRALVALGSYLVNGVGDCGGCHTFPHFLRPGGTVPGTNGNATGNLMSLGSDPTSGNPYIDGPEQSQSGQLKANSNADTAHGVVTHTSKGIPIYQYNHFLAGGRCFGFFMSRNLTPDDDSGMPRGLTEAEFIQVMRTGKDISCDPHRSNPPSYGGAPDPVCSTPEAPGAGHTFNPEVLQSMPWATFHSMTDADLKAIYAYLSSLPQAKACNTVENGCSGFFGQATTLGVVGQNAYAYANTDDCPKNSNNSAPPQ